MSIESDQADDGSGGAQAGRRAETWHVVGKEKVGVACDEQLEHLPRDDVRANPHLPRSGFVQGGH